MSKPVPKLTITRYHYADICGFGGAREVGTLYDDKDETVKYRHDHVKIWLGHWLFNIDLLRPVFEPADPASKP